MLGYVIVFLLGGYLIPASIHFHGIWEAEKSDPHALTTFERFVTAFIGALTWPGGACRYEPNE